jgi:hypothetical protein
VSLSNDAQQFSFEKEGEIQSISWIWQNRMG